MFHDLITSLILNIARNQNQGSFMTYSNFEEILMTGLIGTFFNTYSQIIEIMKSNQEQPILTGEKPAFLFPFVGGWVIRGPKVPAMQEKRGF